MTLPLCTKEVLARHLADRLLLAPSVFCRSQIEDVHRYSMTPFRQRAWYGEVIMLQVAEGRIMQASLRIWKKLHIQKSHLAAILWITAYLYMYSFLPMNFLTNWSSIQPAKPLSSQTSAGVFALIKTPNHCSAMTLTSESLDSIACSCLIYCRSACLEESFKMIGIDANLIDAEPNISWHLDGAVIDWFGCKHLLAWHIARPKDASCTTNAAHDASIIHMQGSSY